MRQSGLTASLSSVSLWFLPWVGAGSRRGRLHARAPSMERISLSEQPRWRQRSLPGREPAAPQKRRADPPVTATRRRTAEAGPPGRDPGPPAVGSGFFTGRSWTQTLTGSGLWAVVRACSIERGILVIRRGATPQSARLAEGRPWVPVNVAAPPDDRRHGLRLEHKHQAHRPRPYGFGVTY